MTKKTRRLIEDFEEAVRQHQELGSKEVEFHREIESNYKTTKMKLLYHIGFLEASLKDNT